MNAIVEEQLPPESFIGIMGLTKVFQMGLQAVRALDGINLEIEPQTFCVIMGPSGSGKSTLLYLLGGLDRPTAGNIRVGEYPIQTLDENQLAVFRRKMVGFVFQSFNLIPSMTALENVIFPMQFSGVSHREQRNRAMKLLDQVGLSDRATHRPTELSGGQQQRVAIARALANEPALILADEPTGNLDSASGLSIMQLLSELHQSGRTVIVVTHDPRMVRFSTHRFYLLDGRMVDETTYLSTIMEQERVAQV
jgi:putative ABC transport system ATP-binding protein